MKFTTVSLCLLLIFTFRLPSALAQRSAPDQLETSKGVVTIQPILHGTLVLTWNGKTIYVDPYGGPKAFEGLAPADLVLITDIHGDHLNQETLNAINLDGASIVAPQAVVEKLPEALQKKSFALSNGSTTQRFDVIINAVPMYNLPEDAESRHTKGRGNGYVLTFGNKNIYISGDTEDIPEMRALKNIDVAFICMNLPFTMDVDQASGAVLAFQPKVVYPYHYRGQAGLSDTERFKNNVASGNKSIEVRLRNWYPTY